MQYELESAYKPAGDQPSAIAKLTEGIKKEGMQTLLGVTGSGKTFTMANIIAKAGKPAIIISHNKTLAAQLYAEFQQFFPKNNVGFFVSYYDIACFSVRLAILSPSSFVSAENSMVAAASSLMMVRPFLSGTKQRLLRRGCPFSKS